MANPLLGVLEKYLPHDALPAIPGNLRAAGIRSCEIRSRLKDGGYDFDGQLEVGGVVVPFHGRIGRDEACSVKNARGDFSQLVERKVYAAADARRAELVGTL